jgi:hypothetical protein
MLIGHTLTNSEPVGIEPTRPRAASLHCRNVRHRQILMANCANFIALRLGVDDAPLIAKNLGWHEPQAFLDMPDY